MAVELSALHTRKPAHDDMQHVPQVMTTLSIRLLSTPIQSCLLAQSTRLVAFSGLLVQTNTNKREQQQHLFTLAVLAGPVWQADTHVLPASCTASATVLARLAIARVTTSCCKTN